MRTPLVVWACAAALAGTVGLADVVINEVMYHPPGDREELQFIELANSGTAPVDLSGWSFSKGVKFTFPARTTLPPGGYTAVASAADGRAGVCLIEVYDLAPESADQRLVNLSTRAVAGAGESTLTAGLVVR